jgi:pimeloyl-ACP methyl ester carboxylesterase
MLCDAALWRAQIDGLEDLAACRVADVTAHDSMGALADSVLAQAPERFALAGVSMGGYLAFEILRRAPRRVERLALLDTTARTDVPDQTERRHRAIRVAKEQGFERVMGILLPMLLAERHQVDAGIVGAVRDMAARVGMAAFVRQQAAIMGRSDSRALLPGIDVPALVLCGREDALTPVGLHEEMAAAIPDADLVVLGGAGHFTPLERPAAVTAALRAWLVR